MKDIRMDKIDKNTFKYHISVVNTNIIDLSNIHNKTITVGVKSSVNKNLYLPRYTIKLNVLEYVLQVTGKNYELHKEWLFGNARNREADILQDYHTNQFISKRVSYNELKGIYDLVYREYPEVSY